jgi:septal ring factor EnvC (AmiA/AmiB activator)
MLPRSRQRSRGTAAARAVLAALAVVTVAVPLAGPAAAAPSPQPGGTSGVLDSRALDRLQARAAEVQTGLQAQQVEIAAARDAMAQAEAAVQAAQSLLDSAEGELAVRQRAVAGYAAAIYRDGGAVTPLSLLLSGGDPGEVLAAMGFLHVVDAHAAELIGVAEAQRQAALVERERAEAALAEAR